MAFIPAAGNNSERHFKAEERTAAWQWGYHWRQAWISRQLPKPAMLQIAAIDTACVLSANICRPTCCACVLIKVSQVHSATDAWQITKNPKHSFYLADPHYWLERSLQEELVWETRYCQVSKKPTNWQISRLSFVPFLRCPFSNQNINLQTVLKRKDLCVHRYIYMCKIVYFIWNDPKHTK